jgi:hypothetical protein
MFTAIPATPTHRAAPDAFHHRRRAGTNLNIDLVFPIRDEISAWLMLLKAELLCEAGMINDNVLDAVIERVAAAIGPPKKIKRKIIIYLVWVGRAVVLIKQQNGTECVFQHEPRESFDANQ